jgi:ATP-dependent Clp protease adaptor protein ClpS
MATPKKRAVSDPFVLDSTGLESLYQVVVHNDDHNPMEYVTICLMKVFGHSFQLAFKIMLEAHERGRSIAEVEGESRARSHQDQLMNFGLAATIEKL